MDQAVLEYSKELKEIIEKIADDTHLLEVGREAIQQKLLEYRECRMSELRRGNGLVIREQDGSDSHVIRFGPETALYIGLKAIAKHIETKANFEGA